MFSTSKISDSANGSKTFLDISATELKVCSANENIDKYTFNMFWSYFLLFSDYFIYFKPLCIKRQKFNYISFHHFVQTAELENWSSSNSFKCIITCTFATEGSFLPWPCFSYFCKHGYLFHFVPLSKKTSLLFFNSHCKKLR